MGFGYVLGWTRPVTIEEVADIAARQLKKHMRTTVPVRTLHMHRQTTNRFAAPSLRTQLAPTRLPPAA
jgi:hypothetical protein